MKIRLYLFLLFIPLSFILAQEKSINKGFMVNQKQRMYINGISGLDLKIIGWDKNEAWINVKVKVNSSDTEYGKEYLRNFDVAYKAESGDVIIDFIETPKKGGWSIFDIFKGDFKYSFSKEISGEIYLPKSVLLIAEFKYSNILFAGLDEFLELKGKGNKYTIKECGNIAGISNEYGEVAISRSSGKLNAALNLSPIDIDDFEGSAKINSNGASVNVNRFKGTLYINSYNSKGIVEGVSGETVLVSELSEFTFKKSGGVLQIYDKLSDIKVYDADGFKLEGYKTNLSAEGITSKAKEKVFITTKYGNYKFTNSTGAFFIDDEHSTFTLTTINGPVYYSAANSKLTGNGIKGDWKSDTKFSEVTLLNISAQKIEAAGIGKLFKGIITNNPKKVEIKNADADVSLTLSKDIKTSVFLTARQGNLSTDFSIHIDKEGSVSKGAERINGGGAVISIETRNGDISLKKQ